jgi:5-formyltetrahydrofolate cyclo-ligase
MDKQNIRKTVFKSRLQLSPSDYSHLSRKVQDRFLARFKFQHAQNIGTYSAIRHEVATDTLFAVAQLLGTRVYYPRVSGCDLSFHHVGAIAHLVPGAFGVCEPQAEAQVASIEAFDLLVVPGVAFDLSGHRLGYGKGFYDRYLADRPASLTTVGLCFEFQLFESLPVEKHDQSLDYIVTENRVIPCCNDAAGSL